MERPQMKRARTLKSGRPTEDAEQIALVDWIRTWTSTIPELENFAAVPNGGKRPQQRDKDGVRFSIEAARLKRMGVSAGYPDVLLDVPVLPYHGLRIEMKSTDPKATTSKDQDEWIKRLVDQGYRVDLCRGWIDAAGAIVAYLRPLYELRIAETLERMGFPLPVVARAAQTAFRKGSVRPEFARFAASVPRW
jgi:hypothetical protein